MLDNRLKIKLKSKYYNAPRCPVCDGECYASDADNLEYIKTRRGTEIFVHTECAKGGVNNNGTV